MATFPEFMRFRAGLMGDLPQLPTLLQNPAPPQTQPMSAPTPPANPSGGGGSGGGFGASLGQVFGGADDPNLTPEQNQQARRQAMIRAGLAMLASDQSGLRAIAEGGLFGQQAGAQIREVQYGRNKHERIANLLKNPDVLAKLSPEEQLFIQALGPDEALAYLTDRLKPRVVGGSVWTPTLGGKGEFTTPPDTTDDWVQGRDTALNPKTGKQELYAFRKSNPNDRVFMGETQGANKAPVYGSPEWFAALEKELKLRGEYAGAGGGGFGAGGIPAAGRTLSAIASMEVAHRNMQAYEQAVLDKRASFDGLDQFQAKIAGHFDANGVVDTAIWSAAMADIQRRNPDLANYLQNEYLWALEDSTLTSRPSDFRTRLDQFVSSMKANPSPKTMRSIWEGRTSRLDGYKTIVPALQKRLDSIAGTTSPAGAIPAGVQDEYSDIPFLQ